MSVIRRVYDLEFYPTAASTLAFVDQFRTMLIDAGMMTEWHDSWSVSNASGGYNYFRVLKLTQDANKTYGSTYVVFCFSWRNYNGTYLMCRFTTTTGGWNTTSHTPVGTQYFDYFNSVGTGGYDDEANGTQLFSLYTGGPVKFFSYTSGSTLCFRIWPLTSAFVLQSSIGAQPSWVDLNKVCVPPFLRIAGWNGVFGNQFRCLHFEWPTQIRRLALTPRCIASTSSAIFMSRVALGAYVCEGISPVESTGSTERNQPNTYGRYYEGAIHLPWFDGSIIPGVTSPSAPLLTGINMAPPLNLKLPSDFCITTIPSASRSPANGSRIDIGGSEVWEVLTGVGTPLPANRMVFMARVS